MFLILYLMEIYIVLRFLLAQDLIQYLIKVYSKKARRILCIFSRVLEFWTEICRINNKKSQHKYVISRYVLLNWATKRF